MTNFNFKTWTWIRAPQDVESSLSWIFNRITVNCQMIPFSSPGKLKQVNSVGDEPVFLIDAWWKMQPPASRIDS